MEWTTGEKCNPEKGDERGSKEGKAAVYLLSIAFGQPSLVHIVSEW